MLKIETDREGFVKLKGNATREEVGQMLARLRMLGARILRKPKKASDGSTVVATIPSPSDAKVAVEVSKDGMEAFVFVLPPAGGGKDISEEDIISSLEKSGIKYGILREEVRKIAKNKLYGRLVKVAEGKRPKRGEDGRLEFLTDVFLPKAGGKADTKPKLLDDGRVDFKELGWVKNIDPGCVIARVVPPSPGEPGIDVFGKEVPAEPGKPAKFVLGKNVKQDGSSIVATEAGMPVYDGSTIEVRPEITVEGDVDYSTGNIRFRGNVTVKGWVRDGFKVHAEGDIVVEGGVEAAEVISEKGSVVVNGPVFGKGRCIIKAGRDVIAREINMALVSSEGSVEVKSAIRRSRVEARYKVVLTDPTSQIIGGKVAAGEEVRVAYLGGPTAVPTDVEVGVSTSLWERKEKLKAMLRKVESELRDLARWLKAAKSGIRTENIQADRLEKLKERAEKYKQLTVIKEKIVQEIEKIEEEEKEKAMGLTRIIVGEKVFPNVRIRLRTRVLSFSSVESGGIFTIDPETGEVIKLKR